MPSDFLRIQNQGSNQSNPETLGQINTPRLNILIVEDDDLNQRMLGLMLRNTAHILQYASNGVEALQSVKSQEFDLVFMDINMPEMDGLDATRRIREWENPKKRLFIVGMTAIMDSAYGNCLQAGMDDIIAKPIDIKKFQGLVSDCASRKLRKTENIVDDDQPVHVPVLDVEGAIIRFAGDRENYEILLKELISSLPDRFQELLTAWETSNWQKLSRQAHRFKGIAANFGFIALSRKIFELEQYLNEGQFDDVSQKLGEIDISVNSVRSEVLAYLEKPANN